MSKQRGFTLMEMIGVMAVIAILASIATPMIFEAIRNAKVTAFVEDLNTLRTAVARFYEDTGNYPIHIPTDTRDSRKQLIRNDAANPVAGWDGPYLEKEFNNPFDEGAYRAILSTANANYQFDFDGDGNVDTNSVVVIRVDRVSDEEARKISDIIDNDGSELQGATSWQCSGRVKRFGTNCDHANRLLIYLAKN